MRLLRPLAGLAVLGAALPSGLLAQGGGYRQPPAPIAQILDAPPVPLASVSPDRATMVLLDRPSLPPISEVAAPDVRLAGFRIDPRTNGGTRDASFMALELLPVRGDGAKRPVTGFPKGARLGGPQWAADGKRFAVPVTQDDGITLWVVDVASARARRVSDAKLNGTLGAPCEWVGAGTRFLCRTIPANRGAAPARSTVPAGPIEQETIGRAAPNRTYQDLLRNADDEKLFDHYFTSQLAWVELDGRVRPVGAPAVYGNAEASPDGAWLLVGVVHRPYSYLVPMGRFPLRTEVWRPDGTVAHKLGDRPLQEELSTSFDAVATGPRLAAWRDDAPATLVWVEALDGGDPAKRFEKRDRILSLAAPFTGTPVTHLDLAFRAGGVSWMRPDLALATERWSKTRAVRTWAFDPRDPKAAPRLVHEYSSEDRYAQPGRILSSIGPNGTTRPVLSPDGRYAFLVGEGASAEGDRPFLDRMELATGKTTRLWRSEAPHYEEVVAMLDLEGREILTRRESQSEVPNYHVRPVQGGAGRQLTRFTDPAPQFAKVTRKLITYRRADGVQLSATLYLPPGYDSTKGRLPFLLWAYPREFRSAAAASQVIGSPYRFTRPTGASHLFALTQGYGVLDNPTMPIVGEGDEEPNDKYVEQLVAGAEAAVNEIVRLGVADRSRIAIGGHSYGAFMTANLLAHSRLFKAGIARSGAYNRTLTPFGFQGEERTFWQAPEVYEKMSPFTFANRVKDPILLIHGMDDDNSGTFPVQSERFYQALRGNGAPVRYVQLPGEAHGYRARESVGHALAEMIGWLDRWLKPRDAKPAA